MGVEFVRYMVNHKKKMTHHESKKKEKSRSETLVDLASTQTATITPPPGYNCASLSLYPMRVGAQANPSYHCVPSDAPCKAYAYTLEFPKYPSIFPSPAKSVLNTNNMQLTLHPRSPISTLTCLQEIPNTPYQFEADVPYEFGQSPSYPLSSSSHLPPVIPATEALCKSVVGSVPTSITMLDHVTTQEDVQALYDRIGTYSPIVPRASTSPSGASLGYPKWITVDGIPKDSGISLVRTSTGERVAQFHHHNTDIEHPCGFPRYTSTTNPDRPEHCEQCTNDANECSDFVYTSTHSNGTSPVVGSSVPNPTCRSGSYSAIASIPCSEMDDAKATPLSEILDTNVLDVWSCHPYTQDGSFVYSCSGQLTDESSHLQANDFTVQAYNKIDCSNPAFASCVMGLVNTLQRDLLNANRYTQQDVLRQLRYNLPDAAADDSLQHSYLNWMLGPGCYRLVDGVLVRTNNDECAPSCSPQGRYVCNGKSYSTELDAFMDESCSSSGDVPCIPYACPDASLTVCDESKGTFWVTSPNVGERLSRVLDFESPVDWHISSDWTLTSQGNNQFSAFAHAPLSTTAPGNLQSVRQLITHDIIANTCHASQVEANRVDRYTTIIADAKEVDAITKRIFSLSNTGCVHSQSGVMVGTPWNIGTAQTVATAEQINNSAFGTQMGYTPSMGCSANPSAMHPNIGGDAWADVLGQLCVDRIVSCETGCKHPLYAFDGGEQVPSDALNDGCGCATGTTDCALCTSGLKTEAESGGGYVCEEKSAATAHILPLPSLTKPTYEWRTATNTHNRLLKGINQSDVDSAIPRLPWSCDTDVDTNEMRCVHDESATRQCTLGVHSQTGSSRPGCYIQDMRFDFAAVPYSCAHLPERGTCVPCNSHVPSPNSNDTTSDAFDHQQRIAMCSPEGVCVYNNKVAPYIYYCPKAGHTSEVDSLLHLDDECGVCSTLPEPGDNNVKSEAICGAIGGTWFDGASHAIAYRSGGTYDVGAACSNQVTDWNCSVVDNQQIECTTGSLDESTVEIDLESDTSNAPLSTSPIQGAVGDGALHARPYTHTTKYENNDFGNLHGLDKYLMQIAKHADSGDGMLCVDSTPAGYQFVTPCDPGRGKQLSISLGYLYG